MTSGGGALGGDEEAYLTFWHELVSDLSRSGVPDHGN